MLADAGDWVVTEWSGHRSVAADVFAETYKEVGRGRFQKVAPVRARQLDAPITVATLEGPAPAMAGDWVVMNETGDVYPIPQKKFGEKYESVRLERELPEYARLAADAAAAQARHLRSWRAELLLMILAALASAVSISVFFAGRSWGIGYLVALVCFLVAAALRLVRQHADDLGRWLETRSKSESLKTWSWRYAMAALSATDEPTVAIQLDEPTTRMEELKALSVLDRARVYRAERLQDQEKWYRERVTTFALRRRQIQILAIGLQCVGAIGAIGAAVGLYSIDVLGLLVAIAASLESWAQLKKYSELEKVYRDVADRLHEFDHRLDDAAKAGDAWGGFVTECEDLLDGETAQWKAKRRS